MEMPVRGLWCDYRFGNSFTRRGVFPDPKYILRGFPTTQRALLYIFYNAFGNAKSRIKFFEKNFITPLDSSSEKNRYVTYSVILSLIKRLFPNLILC